MADKIFTTAELPSGMAVTIMDGCGRHYFKALSASKGDTGLLIKSLISQLVVAEGENLSEYVIDEMDIRDITYLATVIGLMMSENYGK